MLPASLTKSAFENQKCRLLHYMFSFGVAKRSILVKKPFSIIRTRFFDAVKVSPAAGETAFAPTPPPKATNTRRS